MCSSQSDGSCKTASLTGPFRFESLHDRKTATRSAMAVIKGVNERVHLPLYDSLFVRPDRKLRDHVSSNVLKFFVNIHGKTKLETNMQTSSLLPRWNTFEARALRVVISDLPEQCLVDEEQSGTRETA